MTRPHGTNSRRRTLRHPEARCVRGLRLALMVIALTWGFIAVPGLRAQNPKPTDYQVKAAYLYNFGRFVEWPTKTAPGSSFTVCVLGQDPFGPTLDSTLAGETISGKVVVAKRISTLQETDDCQILFLGSTDSIRLNRIIAAVNKRAILTVSDTPQFAERGGMIQFVRDGKRVRFEVNLTATQQAGLTLSSELLKVATVVRRDPIPGD